MSGLKNYIGTPWGVILCVDQYKKEKIKGRIFHRYQKEAIHFEGLIEAFLIIDHFFDELGYPFRGNRYHSFIKEERIKKIKGTEERSDEDMLKNSGNQGTFIIRVEQRQHSTWQGKVTWIEEGRTETFRSALELIKMIDGVLDENDKKEDEK